MPGKLTAPGVGIQGFVAGIGVINYQSVAELNSEIVMLSVCIAAQKELSSTAVSMPMIWALYDVDRMADGVVAKWVQLANNLRLVGEINMSYPNRLNDVNWWL